MVEKLSFGASFLRAFVMILLSETGDKTFITAAVMSMKYNPRTIFLSSIAALGTMTIFSVVFGSFFLEYIPDKITKILSAIIFFLFGVKMILDTNNLDLDTEYENILLEIERRHQDSSQETNELTGTITWMISRVTTLLTKSIFCSNFWMMFVSEWGDRSQISSFILGSEGNTVGVILGCILGHSICTFVAVQFGRLFGKKVSIKTVSICGACVFLLFSLMTIRGLIK
eukprot:GHVP01021728.1.p1 GENE.GHVP01021728.1~~GHVP01021728.1.p1  ORF type:complete len:228 (+),score=32.06 GHVP01021728.1:2-685(+)